MWVIGNELGGCENPDMDRLPMVAALKACDFGSAERRHECRRGTRGRVRYNGLVSG
jgi:hypothetical protein